MQPELFKPPAAGPQPEPTEAPAKGRRNRPPPLPERTGVEWRGRPWGPEEGGSGPATDPRLTELRRSLAEVRRGDDLDALLWVVTVALSWLNRRQAERAADGVLRLLDEQYGGRAAA